MTPSDLLIMSSRNNNSNKTQLNDRSEVIYRPQDHPWVEMPADDSVDKEIRYSLDELRIE